MILILITIGKRSPAFNTRGFTPKEGGSKNKGISIKYAAKVDCHAVSIRNPNILFCGEGIFTFFLNFSFHKFIKWWQPK